MYSIAHLNDNLSLKHQCTQQQTEIGNHDYSTVDS